MFIFFTCIKKTNQKKVQPVTWSTYGRLPCVAHKERATSESRIPLRGTPPSRLSVLCCAARLRDMAIKPNFQIVNPFCAAEHCRC